MAQGRRCDGCGAFLPRGVEECKECGRSLSQPKVLVVVSVAPPARKKPDWLIRKEQGAADRRQAFAELRRKMNW